MYSGKSLVAVAILLAFGTFTVSARDCPKACTLEFNQVCATNGKEYRLFDNPCMMDVFNCEHEFLWTQTKSLAPCLDDTRAVSADIDDCVRPCTMEYNPICAFDGKHYRFFSNICDMHNAECGTDKHFVEASLFNCVPHPAAFKNCEKPCTREYNPVCGTNGEESKVFANPCMLNNEHCNDNKIWQQTRMDECKTEPTQIALNTECEKPCTFEYNPVCGFNGFTHEVFPNMCGLENAHCKDGKKWSATPFTECIEFASVDEEKTHNCARPCNKMYKPVCGTNGQQYKIFNNECEMKNFDCLDNHEWKVAAMELCEGPKEIKEDCVVICPRIYAPVCGSDGQTYKVFDNLCLLEGEHKCDGHNWKQIPFSLCENPVPLSVSPKKDCPMICPLNYLPICAFNGKTQHTFSNECELQAFNCQNNEHFVATFMGECAVPVAEPKKNCLKVCPAIYAPVCAFNGKTEQTFSNECQLQAFNCENDEHFVKTFAGQCETKAVPVAPKADCPMICPYIYAPVCASNGKTFQTFASECQLKASNCQRGEHFIEQFKGECGDIQIEELPADGEVFACPDNYAPECGFDGVNYKVFANECMMNGYNRSHKAATFVHVELSFCESLLNF
ncbi:ovoinhibitor-like [Condylostylus longicornis]|uniref:ovoinhibitor-like n=1 Tax=Condylostylus longicornis TaxID=2530218 RepID=UPI00244DAF3C|nr:ovoinhibitor-like [Condylostylus longicornis]